MVKVILNGCNGKMGRVVQQCAKNGEKLKIVAGIDKNYETSSTFPIFNSIKECSLDADVILDFSRSEALDGLMEYALKHNKAVVLCTTGYNENQLQYISECSKKLPLFRSANMSIGINLISSILKSITPVLFENYDIEIIEKHHNQKVDSPSGTALLLANAIKSSIKEETEFVYGREGNAKREHKDIGIHAVRGGNIVGDHEVIFAGAGEVIEITHKAISREVFALGALKACEFMANKPAGLYSMNDVLNLK
ncbi:4-hydroxy-tetrahydrodipicolinate reductase [Desnuesiella massiliensis]|uniref:4-hydroxy-tetrahydrodipicolinate reductase n=1 Tax=Desnuesiella massiliensis TaxID=1650662 RepID=UPI0006E34A2B|nr:4-hydroxy-tetrahydrodipicolinate reductase [Desnuesiella massiliensis]